MRVVRRLRWAATSAWAGLLLVGLMGLGLRPAFGAEWYAAPGLQLQAGYDSNPRYLVSNPLSTGTFNLSPSLELGARAAQWTGRVIGTAHLRRYPELSELNRNDNAINFLSQYDGQRLIWGLDGSYTRTSILGTTQPLGPQTALVQLQSQRTIGTASPTLTWKITPVDLLRFNYTFQDTSYQDAAAIGLSNFTYNQASVTFQHTFSPRLHVFASPSYSVFDVPASSFQSRTAGLQFGVTRRLSPTLTATVALGARRTQSRGVQQIPLGIVCSPLGCGVEYQSVPASSLNTGVTVDASVTKRLERGQLNVSFSRALTPSGLGTQVETTALNVRLDRPLTPLLKGFVSAYLLRARDAGASVPTSADRDWARASSGLRWQWTQRASVAISYAYTWSRVQPNGQIARDNVIYLTLSYRWPRIPLFQ